MSDPRRGPGLKSGLDDDQKRALWHHMRVPLVTFVALMVLLAINLALGWLHPFPHVWLVELPVMVCMIATVLLFSMDVIEDPPLVRFFSILGFCWVAILFTMTLVDYIGRDTTAQEFYPALMQSGQQLPGPPAR